MRKVCLAGWLAGRVSLHTGLFLGYIALAAATADTVGTPELTTKKEQKVFSPSDLLLSPEWAIF